MQRIVHILSDLREVSHSAIAVVGAAAASSGVLLTALNAVGVHVGAVTLDHDLAVIGAFVVGASKLIDSANNAITRGKG